MQKNKWEYRENFHSTGCGDYDGCYEITNGHIFLCTKDDPENVTETENTLQQIARLMNESGCEFYSNNVLEFKQHIEIQELGYKIDEFKAKCERYAKALEQLKYTSYDAGREGCTWGDTNYDSLSAVAGYNQCVDNVVKIANEALAGDGEKEVEPKGKVIIHNNSDAFRDWVANIKGYRIALLGHFTSVWLPDGVTSEMFEKEWEAYEKANNPAKKEDKQ